MRKMRILALPPTSRRNLLEDSRKHSDESEKAKLEECAGKLI